MNRRSFSRTVLSLGAAAQPGMAQDSYEEPAKKLPSRRFDVVVAGGGTVVEGGTALHSYYNLWKAFPGVAKRNVVRGIPKEIVDRLLLTGGTCGYPEMLRNFGYDSVCTAIDTEMYKLAAFEMLDEAGVFVAVNTLLCGAVRKGGRTEGVITESRSGREVVWAKAFVDCTGYGDLSAHAGAKFTEPNDQSVVNSMGVGNVGIEKLCQWLKSRDALGDYCLGLRDGKEGQIVRFSGRGVNLPPEFTQGIGKLGASFVTTTVRDNYFMFIKVNLKLPVSPTSRDAVAKGELELRRRQHQTIELFRRHLPGCEKAFIARTSPSLVIRRARVVACDYDISLSDVLDARHFDDDVMAYGFHDMAPRLQIRNGGTYGIPYRALRVAGIENLLAAGMLVTSNRDAHNSTRNTVCCMGQGQGAGTAAALCAARNCGTRDVPYGVLRQALERGGVYFEG